MIRARQGATRDPPAVSCLGGAARCERVRNVLLTLTPRRYLRLPSVIAEDPLDL